MTPALVADRDVVVKCSPVYTSYLVAANQRIYKGSHVMIDPSTGYLVVGPDTASCIYCGVADENITSTTAGVKKCKVQSGGPFLMNTEPLSQQSCGSAVYLLDSGTVALISTTTNDLKVGRVFFWVDATHSWANIQSGGTP